MESLAEYLIGDLISLLFCFFSDTESTVGTVSFEGTESFSLSICATICCESRNKTDTSKNFMVNFLYKGLNAIFVYLIYISAAKAKKI